MMYVFQKLVRMFRGAKTLSDESVETVIGSKSELLEHGFIIGDDGSYCLIGKDLNNVTFQGLKEVSLVLVNSPATKVKFSNSTFRNLELYSCAIYDVEIINVSATKFQIINCREDGLKIIDSGLIRSEWIRVSLTNVGIINSSMHGSFMSCCELPGIHIRKSSLNRCQIRQSRMRRSVWTESSLDDADLQSVNFYSSDFEKVSFERACLGDVDLTTTSMDAFTNESLGLQK